MLRSSHTEPGRLSQRFCWWAQPWDDGVLPTITPPLGKGPIKCLTNQDTFEDKRDTQQSPPDTGLDQDCLQATRTVVTLLMGHPSIRVGGPGSQDSRLPGSLSGQREGGRGGRRVPGGKAPGCGQSAALWGAATNPTPHRSGAVSKQTR